MLLGRLRSGGNYGQTGRRARQWAWVTRRAGGGGLTSLRISQSPPRGGTSAGKCVYVCRGGPGALGHVWVTRRFDWPSGPAFPHVIQLMVGKYLCTDNAKGAHGSHCSADGPGYQYLRSPRVVSEIGLETVGSKPASFAPASESSFWLVASRRQRATLDAYPSAAIVRLP